MERFISGGLDATIHYMVSYCVIGESKKTTIDYSTSSLEIEREKICVDASAYLTRLRITNVSGTMVKVFSAYPVISDDFEIQGTHSKDWQVFSSTRQLNDIPGTCVLGVKDMSYAQCVNRLSEEGAAQKDYENSDSVITGDLVTVIKSGKKYISLEVLSGDNALNDISISNDYTGSVRAVRIGGEFNCLMEDGDTIYTDWVRISTGGNFIRMLEEYADTRCAMMTDGVALGSKPAVYRIENNISADTINEKLAFIKGLKCPFEYIEIGAGWQNFAGDWEGKDGFNINAAANQINMSGYMAGIWTAPFLADKNSELVHSQKNWILRHADGSPCTYTAMGKDFYVLDVSSVDCLEYIEMTYQRLSACGYYLHTLDYLSAFVIQKDVILQDPALSLVKAYTRAVKTIKNAVGENGYVIAANAFASPLPGIADCVQVTSNIDVLFNAENINVFPKLINQAAFRGYMSKWWHNMCPVNIRPGFMTKYSLPEIKTIMACEYLTGGVPTIADISTTEELRALKCLLPAVNLMAYTREAYDDDAYIKVVDVEVNNDYHTVCFFNNSFADVELIFRLDNKTCGGYVDHSSHYNVSSYYSRKTSIGLSYDDIVRMGTIPANSCEIVKIAKNNKPQILLSDMHFSMGGEVDISCENKLVTVRGNNLFNSKGTYVVALAEGMTLPDGKNQFSFTVNGAGPFEYKKTLR